MLSRQARKAKLKLAAASSSGRMMQNTFARRRLFLLSFAGAILIAWTALSLVKSIDRNGTTLPVESAVSFQSGQEEAGLPVRLRIPKIGADTLVEHAGVTLDGTMEAPTNQSNVAWFRFGPRPGEKGSAVIAGHYGWKDGQSSVFDNLHQLDMGDLLYVEDDRGTTISFVVREIRSYDQEADASEVFVSDDGRKHLNLITCEGVWDGITQTYATRLVIFSDRR